MTDFNETQSLTTASDCKESTLLEDDNYDSSISLITQSTTTLTNTALFLHDNNNRIEGEVKFLIDQIQTLKEVDEVLENIKNLIRSMSKVNREAGGSNKLSNQQYSFGNASTSVSISNSGAVWDESNSSTEVINNTL